MPAQKTILVVDDKANVRQLLDEYLTQQGFRIVTATNGREALYAARQESPDAILLDIMMPEMDGFQFLEHYRREKSVPVIILTARDEESDTVVGLELGADDYVLKPFRVREQRGQVRRVAGRSERAATEPQYIETVFGVGYRLVKPDGAG